MIAPLCCNDFNFGNQPAGLGYVGAFSLPGAVSYIVTAPVGSKNLSVLGHAPGR